MRFHAAAAILATTALLSACAGGSDGGPAEVPAAKKAAKMLPAWKTPGAVRIAGKADEYDDYRAARPQLYAITAGPDKAGFRSFVEWEDMQTILLSYTGFSGLGSSVTASMVGMVVHGIDAVDWTVLVPDAPTKNDFISRVRGAGVPQASIDAKLHFITYSADSIWMIDFGPFPILESAGTVAFSDFRYYHERPDDDSVPTLLGNLWGPTTYRAPLDLEGGNFTADGKGTCFTTQQAYWGNADKTEAQVNEVFRQYLGCQKMVVLIPEEDGTGHIDMFSKHAAPNVYVLGKSTTANSSSKTVNDLESNASILQAAVMNDGSKLTVYRIPMPYQRDGTWRTYTNSTFANGVNLFPVYPQHAAERAEADAVWEQAMPTWTHVGIDSEEIITWGGAMHCISRQVPKGAFAPWIADGTCVRGACAPAATGGFDGTCQGDSDCVGPKWLCALNDCSGTTSACGDLSDIGCCDGTTVRYCENKAPQALNCAQGGQTCGWDAANGYYDCGFTGADPSGSHPIACPGACAPACGGKACGDDGCGGSCGTCTGGRTCDANGQCVGSCTPSCGTRQCGDDGCGGSCGSCTGGKTCLEGTCRGEYPDRCLGDSSPSASSCPAGMSTFEGCCDQKGRVVWCDGGELYCSDCASLAAPDNTCGWTATDGQGQPANYYVCGATGADPSNRFPMACTGTCTASCGGKECGGDGCGGSCGTCPAGATCDASGQCVGQVPETLPDAVDPPDAPDVPSSDLPSTDLPGDGACVPDCAGRQCGDDGCGGSCGTCTNSRTCGLDGTCQGECVPDCPSGKCGDDGCGGRCAACPSGYACNALSRCVQDGGADDVLGTDLPATDPGPGTGGKGGGGCAAGPTAPAGAPPLILLLGMTALLAFRFVYTTARE